MEGQIRKSMNQGRGRSSFVALSLVALAAVITTGCLGLSKDDGAVMEQQLSSGGGSGIAAFQAGFWAFSESHCNSCHGVTQSPLFALSDVNAAYTNAYNCTFQGAPCIDFHNPSASLFEQRANDGHCGQAGCQGNGPAVDPLLKSWAEAELASGSTSGGGTTTAAKYLTASIAVPTPLPTGATFVPMRWNMSQLAPGNPLVAGAIFEIEVQQLDAASYKVRNPKLVGLTAPVLVTGIHVYVRTASEGAPGTEDPQGNYWINDSVSVQPTPLPTPLPSTPMKAPAIDTNAMGVNVLSSQDYFAIGFDGLAQGTVTLPLGPSYSSLYQNVFKPKCYSCHNPNNLNGGVDLSSYAGTFGNVNTGNPAGSPLYISVTSGNPLMPEGAPALSAAETTAILNWITAGAANN